MLEHGVEDNQQLAHTGCESQFLRLTSGQQPLVEVPDHGIEAAGDQRSHVQGGADAETGTCFGLVEGFETELGYFDLTELAEVTVFGSVPAVERDLYWEPQTLGEIRRQSSGIAA